MNLCPNIFEDKIVRIIDLETTGFNDEGKDRIVEIASYDMDMSTGKLSNPMHHLINPERDIPADVAGIHGITNEMVKDSPVIEEVIQDYYNADYYVAHYAQFEQKFLSFHQESKWLCTYKLAYQAFPKSPNHKLQTLRHFLKLCPELIGTGHRAKQDVKITAALMYRIMWEDLWCIDDLVSISASPVLLRTIPLGKHKGKEFRVVPKSYLKWLLKQSWVKGDLKATVEHYLLQFNH